MDPQFWHERWAENQIAFHEGNANSMLVKHAPLLALQPGQRVFVPLCGKTNDIAWLLSQGYKVVGAELSKLAIEQLFDELEVTPEITEAGKLERYSTEHLDIFVGDIFELSQEALGAVDAIYDRAALVALPEPMRKRYSDHLRSITNNAQQLLIVFNYNQAEMNGPPFSIDDNEVMEHYKSSYQLSLVESTDVAGGLKKRAKADEKAWLLQPL